MRLTRIEIERYRSIGERIEIYVERDVTILLGANDHGKTNILNAIEHLNPDKPFVSDTDLNWDRVDQGDSFPCVRFHLQLDESEQADIAQALRAESESASAEVSAEPPEEAHTDTTAKNAAGVLVATTDPEIPQAILVQRKGVSGALQYFAGEIPAPVLQKCAEQNLPRVEIIRPQERIPDSVALDELDEKTHEFMRGIFYYAGIDPNDADSLFTQDDMTMKRLTEASVRLNETLKADWDQGNELCYKLSHQSSDQRILLRIEDPAVGRRLVRASARSSGFTHFFALKTVLYARQRDYVANAYIFLFDEPGTYLHPSGQHDLLRVLDAIGRQNQVIYSTHSLFMINRTFPSRHRLLIKSEKGTRSDGKPYAGRWGPVIEELGLSMSGTILFAQHVLLAEGDADPVLLQALFQKLLEWRKASADLNAFSVISTESSRNTDALIRILRETSNPPNLLVLVDGDEGGTERLKALKPLLDGHDVKAMQLVGGTTIEDYLPAAGETYIDAVGRYVAGVLKTLGKDDVSGRIQRELRDAAEAEAYTANAVTHGVATWAVGKAKELAALPSKPSKLGIAREYVNALGATAAGVFKDAQLKRGRTLLQQVQHELGIPEVVDPERKVTTD